MASHCICQKYPQGAIVRAMSRTYFDRESPIAALATLEGRAALAIIRTSGEAAIEGVAHCFSHPEALQKAAGYCAVHGWFIDPVAGERIDEVVMLVYRAPHSFTGENAVEIMCHGSPAVERRILDVLYAQGFEPALHGEFSFRAFIHGKTDLVTAEAINELTVASCEAARQDALERLSGVLSEKLNAMRSSMIDVLADINARLDYPEDEGPSEELSLGGLPSPSLKGSLQKRPSQGAALENVPDIESTLGAGDASNASGAGNASNAENASGAGLAPESEPWVLHLRAAQRSLAELLATYPGGKLRQEGFLVVIAGRPNAGKSSLFNLLVREERAIVSPEPGTTRDWLESWITIGEFMVRLIDTAGLRQSQNQIEAEGVRRAQELLDRADIVLYLVDGTQGLAEEDLVFVAQHPDALLLWNKVDRPDCLPAPPAWRPVSAKDIRAFGAFESMMYAVLRAKFMRELHESMKRRCVLQANAKGSYSPRRTKRSKQRLQHTYLVRA